MRKAPGFSVIELMIVVVIITLLSIVAVPSYRKYIVKTKMSEAYTLVDNLAKNEITYFNENDEFYNVGGTSSQAMSPNYPTLITASSMWEPIGYAAPPGTRTDFLYTSKAGKMDNVGTELIASTKFPTYPFYVTNMATVFAAREDRNGTPNDCNLTLASGQSLGIAPGQPNFDWAVPAAIGDLNWDFSSSCTVYYRMIVASPATGRKPVIRPPTILNYGN